MKRTLFILLICLLTNIVNAQDSSYARRIIRDLSDKAMFGRGYAYGGDSLAANYICNELKSIGAEEILPGYRQPMSFYSYAMEGKVSLKIDGKQLSPLNDYRFAPIANSAHGKFDVIATDAKILYDTAALRQFIEKNKMQLAQSFVYIDAMDVQCTEEEVKAMQKMVGRLTFKNLPRSRGMLVRVKELPIWSWIGSDVEREHTTIYVTGNACAKAPKKIEVDMDNRFHLHNTQNLCAMIKGTESPDTMIVFTAHYDHLGCMGEDVIFPGAHDNASGVATVLDLLKHYKEHPQKYSVAGLFFCAEEAALRGSSQFVSNPPFDLEKIALLLNFDLICGGDEGITVVNSNAENTKPFFNQMVKVNDEKKYLSQIKPRDNASNSDHYYFSKVSPAMFIYTLGGRTGNYHHWNDTCENCALNNYDRLLKLVIESIDTHPFNQ